MSTGNQSTGLEPNVAGLLCYLVGWITGLIFFLIEQKDEFVRFHAMQSILFFGPLHIIIIVLSFFTMIHAIWVVFSVIVTLIALFGFVMWIILMIKAYQGERFKLPVVGDMAEKYSKAK